MKARPVVPREQAHSDVEDAIAHHLAEGAEIDALGFIDLPVRVYRHIGWHPATGSPRYAYALNLPGLRLRPLTRIRTLRSTPNARTTSTSEVCCMGSETSQPGCRHQTACDRGTRCGERLKL